MFLQKLLYNRKENKGYIVCRLNHVRQKLYKTELENDTENKTFKKRSKKEENLLMSNNDLHNYENNEHLIVLKNCNATTQKDLIKQKLADTLELRLRLMKNNIIVKISSAFPFFFTNPELVMHFLYKYFLYVF